MKRPSELNAYEYLARHLIEKQVIYERSFEMVKRQLKELKNFRSLNALVAFVQYGDKETTEKIVRALYRLDKKTPSLRPQIIEILMFMLWEDLTMKYGCGDGFARGYWELIQKLETSAKPPDRSVGTDERE